ncbi:MAG: hypothetical protein KTR25_14160 [Myxococcales bacterium]|nr:hypothetical protein [Myxococcales bacterium]
MSFEAFSRLVSVRRLNRFPLVIVGGVLAVFVGMMIWADSRRHHRLQHSDEGRGEVASSEGQAVINYLLHQKRVAQKLAETKRSSEGTVASTGLSPYPSEGLDGASPIELGPSQLTRVGIQSSSGSADGWPNALDGTAPPRSPSIEEAWETLRKKENEPFSEEEFWNSFRQGDASLNDVLEALQRGDISHKELFRAHKRGDISFDELLELLQRGGISPEHLFEAQQRGDISLADIWDAIKGGYVSPADIQDALERGDLSPVDIQNAIDRGDIQSEDLKKQPRSPEEMFEALRQAKMAPEEIFRALRRGELPVEAVFEALKRGDLSAEQVFEAVRRGDISSEEVFEALKRGELSSEEVFEALKRGDISSEEVFEALKRGDISSEEVFEAVKRGDISAEEVFEAVGRGDLAPEEVFRAVKRGDLSPEQVFRAVKRGDLSAEEVFEAVKRGDISSEEVFAAVKRGDLSAEEVFEAVQRGDVSAEEVFAAVKRGDLSAEEVFEAVKRGDLSVDDVFAAVRRGDISGAEVMEAVRRGQLSAKDVQLAIRRGDLSAKSLASTFQPAGLGATTAASPQPGTRLPGRPPGKSRPNYVHEILEAERKKRLSTAFRAAEAATGVALKPVFGPEASSPGPGAQPLRDRLAGLSSKSPVEQYQERLKLVQQAVGAAMPNATMSAPRQRKGYEEFAEGQQGDRWRLNAHVKRQDTPYVFRAGGVIPAKLLTAINSEIPGLILGQVSMHVYDSTAGRHLLVPQGTRLVGRYDSEKIEYGQNRVLVAWQRLEFPNGSTLDIGAMPGAGSGGASGFGDRVNHHYFRIFGSAILLSGIAAGPAFAQRNQPNNPFAASLSQNLESSASAMVMRNLSIAPTIKIRAGFSFLVVATKDLRFPGPYLSN